MNIYIGLIISGVVLLVLGIIADFFDAIDLDLDIGDVEIGDIEISFLPFSLRAISLGVIVYCSMSYIFGDTLVNIFINGSIAYVSAVCVCTFTKFLKKRETKANSEARYLLSEATVFTAVAKDGVGVISCSIPNESVVTFTARSKDNEAILVNTKVRITDFENGIAIVECI